MHINFIQTFNKRSEDSEQT